MKGIILAGGTSTRMQPMTHIISKQLLPVYDKPLIYYPLSTLMMAGIQDVLVITRPDELALFRKLLGDGSHLGINLQYLCQAEPKGIAHALLLAENFIKQEACCLILGDNILYGHGLIAFLETSSQLKEGAKIITYPVSDPSQYAVAYFSGEKIIDIIEKPLSSSSNQAIIGLYFFDHLAIEIAKSLLPSNRGELEITDVNKAYLKLNQLQVSRLGRGMAWLDTGTPISLMEAANFIHIIEVRQGMKICCPEEIAWRKGFINDEQLFQLAQKGHSSYYKYLKTLLARSVDRPIHNEYISY